MTTLEHRSPIGRADTAQAESDSTPNDLVAIEFPDVFRAQEAMLAAARLQRRHSLVLEDTAVVTVDQRGRVRINQTRQPSPLATALFAGTWLWLLGLLFFGTVVGLAAGLTAAAVGALWARRDIGIDDKLLRSLGSRLRPGTAAGAYLVNHAQLAHVLAEARRFEGRLLHSTLPPGVNEQLQEALAHPV